MWPRAEFDTARFSFRRTQKQFQKKQLVGKKSQTQDKAKESFSKFCFPCLKSALLVFRAEGWGWGMGVGLLLLHLDALFNVSGPELTYKTDSENHR